MEKTIEKPLLPQESYLVLSSWDPDTGFSSSLVLCNRLWPLSKTLSSEFSSQNGCFCNVSPDKMTHWGHVNFYLHLFLTVIRPEWFWGQHMSQISNHSLCWKSWWLLLAFCDHIIHMSLEWCCVRYLVRRLGGALVSFISVRSDQRPAKIHPQTPCSNPTVAAAM